MEKQRRVATTAAELPAHRARRRLEDGTERLVEVPDRAVTGRVRDVRHRLLGRDQEPLGEERLVIRRDLDGRHAEALHEELAQPAARESERAGELLERVRAEVAVPDHAQCRLHHVLGVRVAPRVLEHDVGAAAQTRPEAPLERLEDRREVADVLLLRFGRRARGAAEHTRRRHAEDEAPVVVPVLVPPRLGVLSVHRLFGPEGPTAPFRPSFPHAQERFKRYSASALDRTLRATR